MPAPALPKFPGSNAVKCPKCGVQGGPAIAWRLTPATVEHPQGLLHIVCQTCSNEWDNRPQNDTQ